MALDLSKISETLKQGIAKISEATSVDTSHEPVGYSLLKGYQTSWKEIRSRGGVCAKEARLAEDRMVKARAYCFMMDTCLQAWQQPEELANSLAGDINQLVQSIESLGAKMSRLELALDKILEIKDLEQQRDWDQVRLQKLAAQTHHHTKQYREELYNLEQEQAQVRRLAARAEQQAADAAAPISFHVPSFGLMPTDLPSSTTPSSASSSISSTASSAPDSSSSSTIIPPQSSIAIESSIVPPSQSSIAPSIESSIVPSTEGSIAPPTPEGGVVLSAVDATAEPNDAAHATKEEKADNHADTEGAKGEEREEGQKEREASL